MIIKEDRSQIWRYFISEGFILNWIRSHQGVIGVHPGFKRIILATMRLWCSRQEQKMGQVKK
jgi:hypothetical protein